MKVKKTKKTFNGSDLIFVMLFVLLIIAVIFFRNYFFGAEKNSAESISFEYTLEFSCQANSLAGMIKEGDTVYDKEGKNEMGTVLSVQSVPYSEICYNHTDGSAYMADNPDYSNFIVTVRTSGSHTESGYHAGSVRILVGLDINVRLGSFSGSAECIGIREIG